jgi:hypothetical protein
MARLRYRRLLLTAVLAVVYTDFLAVMRWRHREIESITCGTQDNHLLPQAAEMAADEFHAGMIVVPFRCGGVCEDPIVTRRDARPSDWATLATYGGANLVFGCGLWWLRGRRHPRVDDDR